MSGASSRRLSLRTQLMAGILVPVVALLGLSAWNLHEQALRAADTAYDRTLLASAKSIGELLYVSRDGDRVRLHASVPYAALEPFEADNRSRLFYRITGFDGRMLEGFEALPPWRGRLPDRSPYAALVHFYDDRYQGEPVRVAVLLQPVAGAQGHGMATIQVAETLELRRSLARELLVDTLWRQALLVAVIALVVWLVVQRATRPVRRLSAELAARPHEALDPLAAPDAPRELQPLVAALNQVMSRLRHLLRHQQRFVRDASHQLRTPLAVLKVQLQSALHGDVPATQALQEMSSTVDRATELANQMLALAKVEQLRQQGNAPVTDWAPILRGVALDLSALIAQRQLDFEIDTVAAPVRAHEWALRELARNLLHNAIKHLPPGGLLAVRMAADGRHVALTVSDSGPGLGEEQRQRLFEPFAAAGPAAGSGLGLAICREIVESLGGRIALDNRVGDGGRVLGLDAVVTLALAA